MNRYVKKPIAIEAVKWKGFNNDEIKDLAGDSVKLGQVRFIYRSVYHDLAIHIPNQLNDLIPYIIRK